MAGWPELSEPELVERLGLDQEAFLALVGGWAAGLRARPCDAAAIALAVSYPWERPDRSYLLTGERVELLDDLPVPERDAVLERFAGGNRHRIVAIGSNAAPEQLVRKFGHFPDEEDRTVLVLAGHLHDVDVGVAAQPTIYGSLPATLFESPGTAVRAAVLLVTLAQLTQLAWSELTYRFGRLDTRFDADDEHLSLDAVLVFVSRFGTFCPDGRPAALAAIPARNRTAPELTQEQLLDAAAQLCLGAGADAEQLIRAVFADYPGLFERLSETLWTARLPFETDRWTPYPAT
jgi:hypothetical protein